MEKDVGVFVVGFVIGFQLCFDCQFDIGNMWILEIQCVGWVNGGVGVVVLVEVGVEFDGVVGVDDGFCSVDVEVVVVVGFQ